jgi:hypothetical protein
MEILKLFHRLNLLQVIAFLLLPREIAVTMLLTVKYNSMAINEPVRQISDKKSSELF